MAATALTTLRHPLASTSSQNVAVTDKSLSAGPTPTLDGTDSSESRAYIPLRPYDSPAGTWSGVTSWRPRRHDVQETIGRVVMWWNYAVERFTQIGERANTPGYPSDEMLNAAWVCLAETVPLTAPTPSILPSGDDGVCLTWHRGGWDIRLEFDREGSWYWAKERSTGESCDGDLPEDREALQDILRSIGTA